jgi:hypothetical protein
MDALSRAGPEGSCRGRNWHPSAPVGRWPLNRVVTGPACQQRTGGPHATLRGGSCPPLAVSARIPRLRPRRALALVAFAQDALRRRGDVIDGLLRRSPRPAHLLGLGRRLRHRRLPGLATLLGNGRCHTRPRRAAATSSARLLPILRTRPRQSTRVRPGRRAQSGPTQATPRRKLGHWPAPMGDVVLRGLLTHLPVSSSRLPAQSRSGDRPTSRCADEARRSRAARATVGRSPCSSKARQITRRRGSTRARLPHQPLRGPSHHPSSPPALGASPSTTCC